MMTFFHLDKNQKNHSNFEKNAKVIKKLFRIHCFHDEIHIFDQPFELVRVELALDVLGFLVRDVLGKILADLGVNQNDLIKMRKFKIIKNVNNIVEF